MRVSGAITEKPRVSAGRTSCAVADRSAGQFPVTVTLVRRWYDLPPPGGVHAHHSPWQEFSYYTVQLGSDYKPVETP